MAKRKIKKKVRVKSLYARHNTRVRSELLDYDYLNKLSKDDLLWLAQFTDEYVGGAVEKDSKGNVKKGHIHNTPELAKKCYDANNHRNNDVLSVTRANNLAFDIESQLGNSDGWYITNPEYTELDLINKIESDEREEHMSLVEYLSCRDQFMEYRRSELDLEFIKNLNISSDDFYLLVIIYNFKLASSRKIIKMSQDTGILKKFVENSEFFKTNQSSTKKR
jgi:hypothetical protein